MKIGRDGGWKETIHVSVKEGRNVQYRHINEGGRLGRKE